jgi:hypothetical protein
MAWADTWQDRNGNEKQALRSGDVAYLDVPSTVLTGDVSDKISIESHLGCMLMLCENTLDADSEITSLFVRHFMGPTDFEVTYFFLMSAAGFTHAFLLFRGEYDLQVSAAPASGKPGKVRMVAM